MNHISLVGKYLERFYIRRNQLPGLVEIGTEAFARAVAGAGLPPDALQKLRDDLETQGQGQAFGSLVYCRHCPLPRREGKEIRSSSPQSAGAPRPCAARAACGAY